MVIFETANSQFELLGDAVFLEAAQDMRANSMPPVGREQMQLHHLTTGGGKTTLHEAHESAVHLNDLELLEGGKVTVKVGALIRLIPAPNRFHLGADGLSFQRIDPIMVSWGCQAECIVHSQFSLSVIVHLN